jgi:hypothetical protein
MNETQLVKAIKAHIERGDKAREKSDQHYTAAGLHLKELKATTANWVEWESLLKDKIGIGKSRASDLMQIADGRKTVEEIRSAEAEKHRQLRARSPVRTGETSASRGGKDEMPTQEEADEEHQRTLSHHACLIVDDEMSGETRQRFFAHLARKYHVKATQSPPKEGIKGFQLEVFPSKGCPPLDLRQEVYRGIVDGLASLLVSPVLGRQITDEMLREAFEKFLSKRRQLSKRRRVSPDDAAAVPQDDDEWRRGLLFRAKTAVADAAYEDWSSYKVDQSLVAAVRAAAKAWVRLGNYLEELRRPTTTDDAAAADGVATAREIKPQPSSAESAADPGPIPDFLRREDAA